VDGNSSPMVGAEKLFAIIADRFNWWPKLFVNATRGTHSLLNEKGCCKAGFSLNLVKAVLILLYLIAAVAVHLLGVEKTNCVNKL